MTMPAWVTPDLAGSYAAAEQARADNQARERQAELERRLEQEQAASRQRRQQRDKDLDAAWAARCKERGLQPYPRPQIRHTRADGVETLTIVGRAGPRMVYGCASTDTITSHQVSKDPAGCRIQLPIPLKVRHKAGAVGQVVHVRKSPDSLFIRAILDNNRAADHAWDLIQSGEYRAFSVATDNSSDLIAEVDGVQYVRRWTLTEVSLVRQGANPDTWCRIWP
jgi:hypothetical protein